MKSKFLLLLCFYCINAKAQSSVNSPEKTAFIPTDEFCKSIKEIAELASQNKLTTLKQDKFKSIFYNSETSYNSIKKISTALENFIEDDTEFGNLKFEALLKNYDTNADAAKTDFMVIVKKAEDCLGKKASIPSANRLEVYLHYKNCKVTINTFFSNNISKWINTIILENEPH